MGPQWQMRLHMVWEDLRWKEDLSQLRKVVGWNHWNGNRVRQDTTPTHFMQLKSNGNERFPKLKKEVNMLILLKS